jgi:hypothetical protein
MGRGTEAAIEDSKNPIIVKYYGKLKQVAAYKDDQRHAA